jgi:Cytotoxic
VSPGIAPPRTRFVESLDPLGAPHGRKRWRGAKGRLYEWDALHGEFEVYNKSGSHIGVADEDGKMIKDAVQGRKIHV